MAAAESDIKTQQTLNSQDNYIMTLKQTEEVTKFHPFLQPRDFSYFFLPSKMSLGDFKTLLQRVERTFRL